MRTTLNIDDEALQQALQAAPGLSRTEVINQALREFARQRRRQDLLRWRGKATWEGDLDRLRKRKS